MQYLVVVRRTLKLDLELVRQVLKSPALLLTMILSIVLLFACALFKLAYGDTYLNISGSYLHAPKVQTFVLEELNKGFWSIEPKDLEESIAGYPLIKKATVKKSWPNLNILLEQHNPVALLSDDKLLTSEGIVLNKPQLYKSKLPLMISSQENYPEVISKLSLFQKILKDLTVNIKSLELSADMSWQVVLDNGLLLKLGNSNCDSKMKRFALLYKKIVYGKLDEIEYVDLRYNNGLAVGWKS